jgi:hypothetical protein
MEHILDTQGKAPQDQSLDYLEALWQQAKRELRAEGKE